MKVVVLNLDDVLLKYVLLLFSRCIMYPIQVMCKFGVTYLQLLEKKIF